MMSTLIWVAFLGFILYLYHGQVQALIEAVVQRVVQGSSIKVWNMEVGAVNALPSAVDKTEASPTARFDEDGARSRERHSYYEASRRVMLVHKLFQSTERGQLYDILVYVVPAKNGTLSGVHCVEYFFGRRGWKNQIFVAVDRSQGFPVLTAAYGPFLCTAEVIFSDGTRTMLHRFIDFEMGNAVAQSTKTLHCEHAAAAKNCE